MITRILEIFNYKTFSYHLTSPIDAVVEKLDALFIQKSALRSFLNNLKGQFINYPFTFILVKQSRHCFFDKGDAILKGEIQAINPSETSAEIIVRLGLIYPFFFIIFFISGILALIKGIISKELLPILSSAFLFFIALPLISFLASRTANNLRKIFEKQLDILI